MGMGLLPLDSTRADDLGVTISRGWWGEVFALGLRYGWAPAGTESDGPPETWPEPGADVLEQAEFVVNSAEWRAEWTGAYFGNDWQTVTAEDAAELAAALGRAIADYDQWNRAALAADGTDPESLRLWAVDVMNLAAAGGFLIT